MTPATPRQGKTPGPPPGVLLFPREKAPRHPPPPAARARHPRAGPSPVAALLRPLSGACPPLRGPPARKEIPAAPAAGMVCVHEITSLCKRRANPRKAPPRPPPSYNPVNLPPRHLPQTRPTSHFYIPVAMSTDFYIPVRFSPNPPDFRPQPLRVSGQTLPTSREGTAGFPGGVPSRGLGAFAERRVISCVRTCGFCSRSCSEGQLLSVRLLLADVRTRRHRAFVRQEFLKRHRGGREARDSRTHCRCRA